MTVVTSKKKKFKRIKGKIDKAGNALKFLFTLLLTLLLDHSKGMRSNAEHHMNNLHT